MALGDKNLYPFFNQFVRECNNMKRVTELTDKDFQTCEIPINNFLNLFNGTFYTQRVINALNKQVRNKKFIQANKEKMKE